MAHLMDEMDLELSVMFNLSEPVSHMPRTHELTRLDDFFERSDYGIATESSHRDEDLQEISIVGNRVVRKYG